MTKPNIDRAREAYRLIRSSPGIDQHTLQLMLGISKGGIQSTLITCDTNGMLVCEDDDGGLHVFNEDVCDGVLAGWGER